jgi:hypothetical protein
MEVFVVVASAGPIGDIKYLEGCAKYTISLSVA